MARLQVNSLRAVYEDLRKHSRDPDAILLSCARADQQNAVRGRLSPSARADSPGSRGAELWEVNSMQDPSKLRSQVCLEADNGGA